MAVWSWTGAYVGGNIGYSWGRSATDFTFRDATTGVLLATVPGTANLNGVIGGFQIGYNVQADRLVWGIEADIQASGQRGSATFDCAAVTCAAVGLPVSATLNQKLSWFGTVRGRLGAIVSPTVLAYVTGGLAYGEIKSDGTITGSTVAPVVTTTTFSSSTTKAGWVVGGGVEGVIAPKWTAKIEYLYMDLGTVSAGPVATLIAPPVRADFLSGAFSSRVTDNILRVGANYKF